MDPFFPGRPRASEPEPGTDTAALVRAYHDATRHDPLRYARGPGALDWATQPDPFRRYPGAELLRLDLGPTDGGPRYEDVAEGQRPEPAPVDRSSVSRLFQDAFGLSAWKQHGSSTWALRVPPSSGNLHPTEAYLLAGAIAGLGDAAFLAHYAPREHALERRALVPAAAYAELARGLAPGTFFVGLTSIHWREAWKYGERAWRYCQLDAGHAVAAVAIAAAALGWQAVPCDELGHEDLALLLGTRDAAGAEPEEPELLLAIVPDAAPVAALPGRAGEAFASLALAGRPSRLSPAHVEWDAVEAVAAACRKPRTPPRERAPAARAAAQVPARGSDVALRAIVHGRRSAVDFDGRTSIAREELDRFLVRAARPAPGFERERPAVHLALGVHRVEGLAPGLYVLARDAADASLLQAAMRDRPFLWQRPAGTPDGLALHLLAPGDARPLARSLACHQEIAADGALWCAMLARYEPEVREAAWRYPRLYRECGALGQVLYLEAEAAGVRATGIGCFFDEPTHAALGLASPRYRCLYQFTLGGPVEDPRLQTWPAYPPPRAAGGP